MSEYARTLGQSDAQNNLRPRDTQQATYQEREKYNAAYAFQKK